MAAKRRHWKEKGGRFWARISVPKSLQATLGKTELIEALGGDRRAADRNHAAAVARLQAIIAHTQSLLEVGTAPPASGTPLREIADVDYEDAIWTQYTETLQSDEAKRAAMPTSAEIDFEYERIMQKIEAGEVDPVSDPIGVHNLYADYTSKAGARHFYSNLRTRRLAALQASLASGDTRHVDAAVKHYVEVKKLDVTLGSSQWSTLAHSVARAEIQALQQTLGRDRGDYSVQISDPIVKPPNTTTSYQKAVPLKALFHDYIATRQMIGRHRDGGGNWEHVVLELIKFIGHSDARKITKRNLIDWRDALMLSGKTAKTVSDKYIAAINAVLRWAHKNDRLPSNEAEDVRQEVPNKVKTRESGYTTAEAIKILKASLGYQPSEAANPSNRESSHLTFAKQWVPLLCAFTGARVTEITQLRKEDLREEDNRLILRITPDAGSVKTGQYRDVPLHNQIIELGFRDFLKSRPDGPLFHAAIVPEKFLAGARATSGKISQWLQTMKLVPDAVQPSYGWRHRFKTQGRELAMSDRVLDAIQGHPGKTASDRYGDVTIVAKLKLIDALPYYDLKTSDYH